MKLFKNSRLINKIKSSNSDDGDPLDDVDLLDAKGIDYLRNKIFSSLMIGIIVLAIPIFIYGIYLFIREGNYFGVMVNTTGLALLISSLKVKKIPDQIRKIIAISAFYSVGVIILIETGIYGSGFVIIFFSLIMGAFFLEKRVSTWMILFNIFIFMVLTTCLYWGIFDDKPVALFKDTWLINVYLIQLYGIAAILLMNIMFAGLKMQSSKIKEANAELLSSKKRYQEMIANIVDVIVVVDTGGVVKYISPNVQRFYGWTSDEVRASSLLEKIPEEDREDLTHIFRSFLKGPENKQTIRIRHCCKDGEIKDLEATLTNLRDDPLISGILINFHDVTERRRYQQELTYISHHDELTGLYNRSYFNQIKKTIDHQDNLPISLISADIDGLKIINDSLGHQAGDRILKAAARVFKKTFRKEEIIARVGGDEFYILLPKTRSDVSAALVERINNKIDTYNKQNSDHNLSISMGLATKTSMTEDIDAIFQKADYQMYAVKNMKKDERVTS